MDMVRRRNRLPGMRWLRSFSLLVWTFQRLQLRQPADVLTRVATTLISPIQTKEPDAALPTQGQVPLAHPGGPHLSGATGHGPAGLVGTGGIKQFWRHQVTNRLRELCSNPLPPVDVRIVNWTAPLAWQFSWSKHFKVTCLLAPLPVCRPLYFHSRSMSLFSLGMWGGA